jgi:hypothetical protein
MDRKDKADVELPPLSDEEHWLAAELVKAGYRPGRAEIGGYLVRVAEYRDDNKFLVPGPFERGRRYLVQTTTDGRNYMAYGWIGGTEILRHGERLEVNGRSAHAIDRRRLKPVLRNHRGGAHASRSNPTESFEKILKERYNQECAAALGFSMFMGCPFPPPGLDDVPLGHVEVAGFTIRPCSKAEGGEVFLSDPLEPDRRYAAVVFSEEKGGVEIYGWILGQDAVRCGRQSETEWGGVWVNSGDLNKFAG